MIKATMNPYTVIYVTPAKGLEPWQFFECHAADHDAAESLCLAAHPACAVLWVNAGHGAASRMQEGQ